MGAAPHLITTGLSRSASPIHRSSSTWARSAIPIYRGYSIVIGFEVDPQGTLAERHVDGFRDRGRRVEPLEVARKAISDAGGSAIGAPADVRDFDAIGRAVQKAQDKFGALDVLANNAACCRDRGPIARPGSRRLGGRTLSNGAIFPS